MCLSPPACSSSWASLYGRLVSMVVARVFFSAEAGWTRREARLPCARRSSMRLSEAHGMRVSGFVVEEAAAWGRSGCPDLRERSGPFCNHRLRRWGMSCEGPEGRRCWCCRSRASRCRPRRWLMGESNTSSRQQTSAGKLTKAFSF